METIIFLIVVGVVGFGVVVATQASKRKTDLAAKHKSKQARQTSAKLSTPIDTTLTHREQIWEMRRNRAAKGYVEQTFIPKSVAKTAPEYDGYSRRDRHHVTTSAVVKKEKHIEDVDELKMSSVKFNSGKHAAQT